MQRGRDWTSAFPGSRGSRGARPHFLVQTYTPLEKARVYVEALSAPGGATPAEEAACGAAATNTNGGSGALRAQKARKAPPPEAEAKTTEELVSSKTEPVISKPDTVT
jgi:hypothetical protein